jgi:hypothetical protein
LWKKKLRHSSSIFLQVLSFQGGLFYFYRMEEQNLEGQLNIELSEEIAEGIYSNLAIITHSNTEFVIDFIRVMPGVPKARVKSRIVLTPEHAKRLARAIEDNIEKFEAVNGRIKVMEQEGLPMNFGGPTAQA